MIDARAGLSTNKHGGTELVHSLGASTRTAVRPYCTYNMLQSHIRANAKHILQF